MGVSEQIQEELRRGRTPEEVLELWARERACGILGGLRDDPAFAAPPIVGKLESETDYRVLIGCARALGQLGSATAEVKAALEKTATSSHPDIKKAATDALAKLEPGGH